MKTLTFKELTVAQKAELEKHAHKLANKHGAEYTATEIYESFKDFLFQEICGHLHFALFHPISMLEAE